MIYKLHGAGMPWVKGNLTYGQLSLLTALSLIDSEDAKKNNPSEEKDDPYFLQKLNEAREKALKRQQEIAQQKYTAADRDNVVSELTKAMAEALPPEKKD